MADKTFFARLQTLFSTSSVIHDPKTNKIKVVDVNKIQSMNNYESNRAVDNYIGVRSTTTAGLGYDPSYGFQLLKQDLYRDYECLAGETIIPLPDGRRLTMLELACQYPDKKNNFYVYSYDCENNCIKLGIAHSVRKTKTEMTYKITFDNGEHIIATSNHPFLMRDGEYKQVRHLQAGDSLMPFYRKNFYREEYDFLYNFSKGWQSAHKIVAEQFNGPMNNHDVVHHKDFNKHNNTPENLQTMLDTEHKKYHCEATLNHKIKSIEEYQILDVYDMTVEKYHNFATENVFVHNSMDQDSILASALDIYADECLGADTIIPLMDGRKLTIKELHDSQEKDFWVYSYDNNIDSMIPAKCEFVKYNGKKKMYQITLDDNTIINASENHLWVIPTGELIYTDKIKPGQSLKVFATKISDNNQLCGYEMIKNGKYGWEYTHRVVAKNNQQLLKSKENKSKDEQLYIHHASFNKRNNSPDKLEWLNRNEHLFEHARFNKELWSDDKQAHIYKQKIREAHKKYWTPELKANVAVRQHNFMCNLVKNTTFRDRSSKFGNPGKLNGMFGKGYKISGEKNGRYNHDKNHICDINLNACYEDVVFGLTNSQLEAKYNTSDVLDINKKLCKLHNCKSIKNLRGNCSVVNNLKNVLPLSKIREELHNLELSGKNPLRNINKIACKYNTTTHILLNLINEYGYQTFGELLTANNHKVTSIEYIGEADAYDLVNVGDTHIYAIETLDNGKLFCHNSTMKNEYGDMLKITAGKEAVRETLNNLFYDTLNIEFNMWPWVRNLCKYGDMYLKLDIIETIGVTNVLPLSPYYMTRQEDPNNPDEIVFKYEATDGVYVPDRRGQKIFNNYEIAHFRLISDTNFFPYGKSMLEPARKVWGQLSLMEDAMMIHRIMRAPQKRIFKIDIGSIPPNEVDTHMNQVIDKMKKVPYMDESTGNYNLKFNLQNMLEDFYLPVRGGTSGTEISDLGGMEWTGTEDIEYLRNRMMAALKVPKAFLGYEEQINAKATLAAEDVRFARTIERIQRIIVSELTKIAIIHLYAQGYKDMDLVDFSLDLTTSSTVYDLERLELWTQKVSLARDARDLKMLSEDWIYENIFKFSDDQRKMEKDRVVEDVKRAFRLEQIGTEGNDPTVTSESFGTRHDLAMADLAKKNKVYSEDEEAIRKHDARKISMGTAEKEFQEKSLTHADGDTYDVKRKPTLKREQIETKLKRLGLANYKSNKSRVIQETFGIKEQENTDIFKTSSFLDEKNVLGEE